MKTVLTVILLAYAAMALFHACKPMPPGLDAGTPFMPVKDAVFLVDETYTDSDGNQHTEQVIFDEILRLVDEAERLVVLDMFLFNDFAGDAGADHRPLSRELTDALIRRQRERPHPRIVLITDPLNTFYGGSEADHLQALEAAGVRVVVTDLDRLRDSNPLWSGWWRLCCRWLPDGGTGTGWLPKPVGEGRVTLRSYLRMLNLKANHRKTLIADAGESWVGLVTSANPHDASSRHSNVALRFSGEAALALLSTEQAVMNMSGVAFHFPMPRTGIGETPPAEDAGEPMLRVLTESRIREAALTLIRDAGPGDRLELAMFYLSHRALVEALMDAHRRGVQIRVLLDPNRDAFGREKNGIPNRQVAMELHEAGIPVRWCDTRGEQCHDKFLRRQSGDASDLLLGSANFTRRNLDNYNLETNVHLHASTDTPAIREAAAYFQRRWENASGRLYSLPYEAYADHSYPRYWRYRIMEATGLSAF